MLAPIQLTDVSNTFLAVFSSVIAKTSFASLPVRFII